MSVSIAPESRIFRIGRECYVIYLGKERDDVQPFLRIGSTRGIPTEVHEAIATAVITDDHSGNPLLEILDVPKFSGRYLGDPSVVKSMKRFFKSFDLPTEELTDYREVHEGEKRHMVWFYTSGNIHLRYEDKVIFDLYRREREDRHFIRLFEEAKGEFLRNPLRYIRGDFKGPGIIVDSGNAFWFESGELMALSAHPGFVSGLMTNGVDPDFVSTMAFDLDADSMASRDAAVYIGFLKRVRQRRKELQVITSQPALQRKLRLLFPARNGTPASLSVSDVSGRRKATFRDSVVSRKGGKWSIHRAGLPGLSFDGDDGPGLTVDTEDAVIRYRAESVSADFALPSGFPVTIESGGLTGSQAAGRYAGYLFNQLKSHFSDGDLALAGILDKFLRIAEAEADENKKTVNPGLRHTAGAFRDALRRSDASFAGPSWFYFSNVLSLLVQITDRGGEGTPVHTSGRQVIAGIQPLLKKAAPPDPALPFWGDLYLGEKPYLLWRPAKRTYSTADLASAHAINGTIESIVAIDEQPWKDDLERLLRLIRSLRLGGEGQLTAEQMAILAPPTEGAAEEEETAQPVRRRPAPPQPTRRKPEPATKERPSPLAEAPKPAPLGKIGSIGPRSKPIRRQRLLRPGMAAAVLGLIVVLGVGAWDLSGRAPWGSLLRGQSDIPGAPGNAVATAAMSDDKDSTGTPVAASEDKDSTGTPASGATGGDSAAAADAGVTDATSGDRSLTGTETGGPASGATGGESAAAGNPGAAADSGDRNSAETEPAPPGGRTPSGGAEAGTASAPPQPVDSEIAPRTMEDVRAYLDINGRLAISEADIHLAANEIAVLNGYKDLDYRVFTGADPDWIFPGNILILPDRGQYTITRGDTIWFLAAREVRVAGEQDLAAFDGALTVIEGGSVEPDELNSAVGALKDIADNSRVESMRELAQRAQETQQR